MSPPYIPTAQQVVDFIYIEGYTAMWDRIGFAIHRGCRPGDGFGFQTVMLQYLNYYSITLCHVNLFNLNSS